MYRNIRNQITNYLLPQEFQDYNTFLQYHLGVSCHVSDIGFRNQLSVVRDQLSGVGNEWLGIRDQLYYCYCAERSVMGVEQRYYTEMTSHVYSGSDQTGLERNVF